MHTHVGFVMRHKRNRWGKNLGQILFCPKRKLNTATVVFILCLKHTDCPAWFGYIFWLVELTHKSSCAAAMRELDHGSRKPRGPFIRIILCVQDHLDFKSRSQPCDFVYNSWYLWPVCLLKAAEGRLKLNTRKSLTENEMPRTRVLLVRFCCKTVDWKVRVEAFRWHALCVIWMVGAVQSALSSWKQMQVTCAYLRSLCVWICVHPFGVQTGDCATW